MSRNIVKSFDKLKDSFTEVKPTKDHTPLTPAEVTEPPEPPKKKPKRKKKDYLRLDITGLNEYLIKAAAYKSIREGKQISKTAYIQELIRRDRDYWEKKRQERTKE